MPQRDDPTGAGLHGERQHELRHLHAESVDHLRLLILDGAGEFPLVTGQGESGRGDAG